jgi:hypothetical protein
MDDSTKYLAVVEANNQGVNAPNNRLVGLKTRFRLGDMTSSANPQFFTNAQRRAAGQVVAGLFSLATNTVNKPKPVGFLNANGELAIDRYIGGAQSVYGIGNTTILRRIFTEDATRIDTAIKQSRIWAGKSHLNQDPTEIQLTGNSILYPISSKYTNSGYAPAGFGSLNTANTNLRSTLIDRRPSSNDKTTSGDKANAAFNDANRKARSTDFREASLYSTSAFTSAISFGTISSPNNGLNDEIATDNDKALANKSKGKVASADEKARTGSFRQASLYSSSSFSQSGSFGTISSPIYGLNEITKLKTYNNAKTWTPLNGVTPRQITPDTVLGVGEQSISTYEDKVTNVYAPPSNVIPYGASKTYAALKSQIKTSISQPTAIGAGGTNFTTDTFIVNKSDPNFKYVDAALKTKFNRTNDKVVSDDTLALVFNPLDPFTGNPLKTLSFLGYITDYTENYDSGWSDIKYVGRAENFYTFNSFKRSINVGFSIPCFRKSELEAKHCALSELASALAGKYSNNGLLGGIITRLKVGGYINNQPGIINNLTFSPIQDSSWDLDSGFAFYLKVSFGFTVIHNFLPQFKDCGFLKDPPKEAPVTSSRVTTSTTTTTTTRPTAIIPVTSSVVLPDLGATRQRAVPVSTYVAPSPTIIPASRRFGGFRGGLFGGGGAEGGSGIRKGPW